MSETSEVLFEERGGAAWITINRPTASNAVSLSVGAAIRDGLARAEADPAIRAIVLTGGGDKVFSAGADLKELPPTRHDPAEAEAYDRAFDATMLAVENCAKPTVARLNGHVVGGSLALAMGCDFRIAAERVRFRIPVARLGFMYTPDQTARIVRAIGPARTKLMMFSANPVSSAQALQWGLVDLVAPDEAFDATCEGLVADIVGGAPLTHGAMKQIVNAIAGAVPLSTEGVSSLYHRVYDSADLKEGLAAVNEKREPVFTGA